MALCTRLKRRVFTSGQCKQMAKAELVRALGSINVYITNILFLEYGIILELENRDDLPSSEIAYTIRSATSKKIRDEFAEFSRMPSLWQREYFCRDGKSSENGQLSEDIKKEIEAFYDKQKTR